MSFSGVKNWFTRNATLLVACFAVGMVCHAQMYLNGLSNPDAVVSLSNPNGYGSFVPHAWDMSLGRWGLLFAAYAKFGLCSPILTSAITIALFTLGIVVLVDRLGIKRACLRYASSILLIVSPFVSCCITYYYCSNSYALSFLCAVLAVCLIGRVGAVGKPVALVGAVVLLAFSLGCYQASLGVFCVAVLLVMVRSLMGCGSELLTPLARDARSAEMQCPGSERGSSADPFSAKQFAVFFGVAVAVCAAGAVLYYALTELSLFAMGIGLSAYGGASSVGAGSILGSLPSSVPSAYAAFFDGFFSHGIFGNHFAWMYVAAIGMAVTAAVFIGLVATAGVKRLVSSVVALLCVVLIPFAANVILVIVPSYGYPTPLMLGGFMASFLLLPLLVQLLLDSPERRNACLRVPAKAMSVGCCCLIAVGAWSYALQSNADAEVMQACQNQTASLATRIAGALDANPDVQAGAKVLIAGKPEAGNYPNTSDSYVHASSYAKWGMVWDNHYQNNMRSWDVIMKQFAGQSFNYCSFDECAEVIRSNEFANMSLYPANDSVAAIDGVVVVKISDISKYSE
ncbi:MAG: glucosyltransferase domain-containing protein [Eggerthella sp.]|nr:glucosyltransferase domain-containing protein [Eggerthella sp.]